MFIASTPAALSIGTAKSAAGFQLMPALAYRPEPALTRVSDLAAIVAVSEIHGIVALGIY